MFQGGAAFWYNLLPSGESDKRTLHAGCPVLLGSKWSKCTVIFELFNLSSPRFYWGSYYPIVSFMCMFCRSLFVLLYFFFWPLCCVFFFELRILIVSLVSLNYSYIHMVILLTDTTNNDNNKKIKL